MEHSITIPELLKRPIIRSDKPFEWQNKMSDEEYKIYESEIMGSFNESGEKNFSVFHTTKTIDRCILYDVFKLNKK